MAEEEAPAPFAEVAIDGHELAILRDGEQAYPAMLDAIARARTTICFESYIFIDDATGRRFLSALIDRAQAGVEVNLLYDAWGSSLSAVSLSALHAAGVRTVSFHPLRFQGTLGRIIARMWRRNHRKSLVVDSEVGFTGGFNIADDYAPRAWGGAAWRDTHLRLIGPAAVELQQLFMKTWRHGKGARLDASRYPPPRERLTGAVRVIGSELSLNRRAIRHAYLRAIEGATHRIWLTNAYFLPTPKILRALKAAAVRGVDVAVIVAGVSDVPAVMHATRALYGKLLGAGIRIFEWRGRVLHAKTAVIDGRWSTVGSSNLDALSLRVNLEVNAVLEDVRFAAAMERMFAADLVSCEEVRVRVWARRSLKSRVLSFFASIFHEWL